MPSIPPKYAKRVVFSVAELAELTPLSPETIRERLADPTHPLRGFKDGREWLIYRESVEVWLGIAGPKMDPEMERQVQEVAQWLRDVERESR